MCRHRVPSAAPSMFRRWRLLKRRCPDLPELPSTLKKVEKAGCYRHRTTLSRGQAREMIPHLGSELSLAVRVVSADRRSAAVCSLQLPAAVTFALEQHLEQPLVPAFTEEVDEVNTTKTQLFLGQWPNDGIQTCIRCIIYLVSTLVTLIC